MNDKNIGIQRAIEHFGGTQSGLAKKINVSRAQVWQWLNNINSVSVEKSIEIEDKTNGIVRCEELRPDINWSVIRRG